MPQFLLSAVPPSEKQERLALAVGVFLFGLFLATVPFLHRQLPRQDAFIPVVDTLLFLTDLITATLLYAQYFATRTWGLLALASGYLFTALIIVPHALTFPYAFAPTGLLGAGLQTTVWLYVFWHMGLPLSAIAYGLLKSKHSGLGAVQVSLFRLVLASITAVGLLVVALTCLVTAKTKVLPPIMIDPMHAGAFWHNVAAPIVLAIFLTSIVIMWRRRSSVLDLWVLVALWAWLIETILLSTTDYRFSVVWYAGRLFGLFSSSFVLLVLLSESTILYARLAHSVTVEKREREGKRITIEVMVGSIAHELRQPLTAIVANGRAGTRLLARKPPDLDELRASLEDITNDGCRAGEILESIRAMFTGSPQNHAPVDLNELVRDTLSALRIELRTHGVTLQLELASDLPRVQGHRGQLQQVLLNTTMNAIESMDVATDRTRLLTITTTANGAERISLLVADSGTGIPVSDTQRIFEPFFTTKSQGMGLGLAVCRLIIDAHRGRLSTFPNTGYGSVFRVDLPVLAKLDAEKKAAVEL